WPVKRAGIVGLGLWLPDEVRRNDAWPASFSAAFRLDRERRKHVDMMHVERADESRPFEELFRRHALPHYSDPFKGAVERRIAPPEDSVAACDARAARLALLDGRIDPADVDLVLSSAVLPDRVSAPNTPVIQDLTGCHKAAALGVESFCSSAVSQLELATAM